MNNPFPILDPHNASFESQEKDVLCWFQNVRAWGKTLATNLEKEKVRVKVDLSFLLFSVAIPALFCPHPLTQDQSCDPSEYN